MATVSFASSSLPLAIKIAPPMAEVQLRIVVRRKSTSAPCAYTQPPRAPKYPTEKELSASHRSNSRASSASVRFDTCAEQPEISLSSTKPVCGRLGLYSANSSPPPRESTAPCAEQLKRTVPIIRSSVGPEMAMPPPRALKSL
eukprot:1789368-Prymnesium_polylepis.4